MSAIIDRFDNELKRLRDTYRQSANQRFLSITAPKRRKALQSYIERHGHFAGTVRELVAAGIAPYSFYHIAEAVGIQDARKSLTLPDFLEGTKHVSDVAAERTMNVHMGGVLMLYLVRAAYGYTNRPSAEPTPQSPSWADAANQVLRRNGFTEDQLELIRSDASVRSALAQIVGGFAKSP